MPTREEHRLQTLGLVFITWTHLDVLDLEGLRAQLSGDNPSSRLYLT